VTRNKLKEPLRHKPRGRQGKVEGNCVGDGGRSYHNVAAVWHGIRERTGTKKGGEGVTSPKPLTGEK